MLKDVASHAEACGISAKKFMRRLLVRIRERGKSTRETIRGWVENHSIEESKALMKTSGLMPVYL